MPMFESDEVARFWSHVVKGPGERDCWIWVGAISDDGYGRFWTIRHGKQSVYRPSRYAFQLAVGNVGRPGDVVEHLRCDNPICVRADGTELDHLAAGTQGDNLSRLAQRGRGHGWRTGYSGRHELAARSRAIRAAVIDGWDEERIQTALETQVPGQALLW